MSQKGIQKQRNNPTKSHVTSTEKKQMIVKLIEEETDVSKTHRETGVGTLEVGWRLNKTKKKKKKAMAGLS